MSEPMTDRAAWIKARLGDELGLSDDDLAALYQTTPGQLTEQLTASTDAPEAVVKQIIADIDGAAAHKARTAINDTQLATLKSWIGRYPIRKLVPLETVSGLAWRLTADDAQWIAFRLADVIGLDFAASDVLRQRLNRVALSYEAAQPPWNDDLRAQITAIAIKLAELTGVL